MKSLTKESWRGRWTMAMSNEKWWFFGEEHTSDRRPAVGPETGQQETGDSCSMSTRNMGFVCAVNSTWAPCSVNTEPGLRVLWWSCTGLPQISRYLASVNGMPPPAALQE